jgi:hypothetical protein
MIYTKNWNIERVSKVKMNQITFIPSSPEEDDSVKEGVPSVHVGVGVWPPEMIPLAILNISPLPRDDALLFDRTSNWTSDMLLVTGCTNDALKWKMVNTKIRL